MRTVEDFLAMDPERVAHIAAALEARCVNQVTEINHLHDAQARSSGALHSRRLQVADLRTQLGLPIDRDCRKALDWEAALAEDAADV